MMTVLDEICAKKRDHIRLKEAELPFSDLKSKTQRCKLDNCFRSKIMDLKQSGRPALIAEVKKASPSKGLIRADFDPTLIAKTYEASGAACISVLTDTPYFQGSDQDFKAAREAVNIPAIRKDFMLTPYQIYESRHLGADCVLLIMAALTDEAAVELYSLARKLGMSVLVEVHDEEELERALLLKADMIGVNNRNLKTLDVSLETSRYLIRNMPDNVIKVAESGIHTNGELESLFQIGYNAFLVGESLMRQENIEQAVQNLLAVNMS